MKKVDDIVVGSGAGGMTASLLLALAGHRVLLLEKAPMIGGSLSRFEREGIPFDVGLHFTGGLCQGGILDEMLKVLGIRDTIEPMFLSVDHPNRFVFESDQSPFDIPAGVGNLQRRLQEYFPGEKDGIAQYFAMVQRCCERTPAMSLRAMKTLIGPMDEDDVSLQEVLDRLVREPRLKALLAGFCMCYGAKPKEISFANHSRMVLNLYESVARVQRGGDAFIDGFRERLGRHPVEILCNTTIERCEEVRDRTVGRFVLSTGEDVICKTCLFTIHPQEILKILPREHLSPAFVQRVESFEPSSSFFSLYGVIDPAQPYDPTIVSLLPHEDVSRMVDPSMDEDSALVLLRSLECVRGSEQQALVVLEPAPTHGWEPWSDSVVGHRPSEYLEYKERRVQRICERIARILPEYRSRLRVLDSATALTYRDYLHAPFGCAFGVKQKMGQINLFGKLPLRNLFAAGQSAILPGVVGAMVSSFLVVRSVLGVSKLEELLDGRLGP